jgi:hypothetical protein
MFRDEAFLAADQMNVAFELHHIIEVILNEALGLFLLAVVHIEVILKSLINLFGIMVWISSHEVRNSFFGLTVDIIHQKLRLSDVSVA